MTIPYPPVRVEGTGYRHIATGVRAACGDEVAQGGTLLGGCPLLDRCLCEESLPQGTIPQAVVLPPPLETHGNYEILHVFNVRLTSRRYI